MIKLVYSPEDNIPITGDLCMVSLGIQAIINAMRSYTLDDTSSPEAGKVLVSVWPVLQVLIEPITDYFFDPDTFAPPKKADAKQDIVQGA
jgi:hypothetical protein